MLMMIYLNVFYLPTLKDFAGRYILWNEVTFWFTPILCCNVYIPLLKGQICPEMQGNKIHALYDKRHKESYSLFSMLASK